MKSQRNLSYSNTPIPSSNNLKKIGNDVITNSSLEISRDISNKLSSNKHLTTNRTNFKTKTAVLQKDFNSSPGVNILFRKLINHFNSMGYGAFH